MDTNSMAVAKHLRTQLDAGPTDGELLAANAANKDESAFAALLARHGPLVLGVPTARERR